MRTFFQKLMMLVTAIMPLAACASDSDDAPEGIEKQLNCHNTVVVYFSCTNTTKGIAEKIANVLDCETWRIVPEVEYTSADLNYNNNNSRANREQNDPSARPAIRGTVDLSRYDVVYVGYPIWWGKLPKILWTFFDAYDLGGKTIIPFCTSGGSGISTSVSEIRSLEPDATVKDGRRFESNSSMQTVSDWVTSVQPQTTNSAQDMKMNIIVNGRTLTATLAETEAANKLSELLKQNAIQIIMSDYGGFEKVGRLPQSLPRDDSQIATQPGDIMLYQGNQMVIFYDTNTWTYTRLGCIEDLSHSELRQALGSGDITATLSLPNATAISSAQLEKANGKTFRLDGILAEAGTKGIVIRGGKKTLRK